MEIVKTTNLSKQFKNKIAVDQVNFTINEGEIYGLIGKNGAGKTTLFKMLLGLTQKDNGEIKLFDSDDLLSARKKIGYLIESPAFDLKFTAYQNLKYLSIQKGISNDDEIYALLKLVGLENETNKKFGSFSLGMKQRLGIAFALLGSPSLLILDEPINGLDPEGIKLVRDILISINKEKHTTILISSHLISELSKVATSFGVMSNGKLIRHISNSDLSEHIKPYLKLVVDDTAKTMEVLRKLGATNFKPGANNTIYSFDLLDKLPDLSKEIATNGIVIFEMKIVENDIENYFIALLGGLNA